MESQRIQMDTDALMHLSDLLKVLFKKLRLQEHLKKKKKSPRCKKETASAKTLQMYQDVHPLPKIIQEYREVKRAKSSFVDDAYVHMLTKGHFSAKWSQTSVVTGRLFSANPNFDAVPREPLKIALMPRGQGSDPAVTSVDPRAVYVSEEGWTFVAAGFCQLELRLLAHFSGDRKLVHLFSDAEADAYALLASEWMHERAAGVRGHGKKPSASCPPFVWERARLPGQHHGRDNVGGPPIPRRLLPGIPKSESVHAERSPAGPQTRFRALPLGPPAPRATHPFGRVSPSLADGEKGHCVCAARFRRRPLQDGNDPSVRDALRLRRIVGQADGSVQG
ncbi:DNA polymerase nu isoform X7 [Syngnathus acus]|uniref:DNA polymerase nu isoform X7 n=1 Tax=Syngnathus acus TaxID=161584 RepID=UPI001885C92C|nr:DNA polymerase nu isoform X7 [Syngnathus acus]